MDISQEKMHNIVKLWHGPEEISPRQRYESALQRHAKWIRDEQYLLQGVKLGIVMAVWDGAGRWKYVPDDHPLWLETEWEDVDSMDDEEEDEE